MPELLPEPVATRIDDTFPSDTASPRGFVTSWTIPWALIIVLLLIGVGFLANRERGRRRSAREDRLVREALARRSQASI